jgi:hypothetical protein
LFTCFAEAKQRDCLFAEANNLPYYSFAKANKLSYYSFAKANNFSRLLVCQGKQLFPITRLPRQTNFPDYSFAKANNFS